MEWQEFYAGGTLLRIVTEVIYSGNRFGIFVWYSLYCRQGIARLPHRLFFMAGYCFLRKYFTEKSSLMFSQNESGLVFSYDECGSYAIRRGAVSLLWDRSWAY